MMSRLFLVAIPVAVLCSCVSTPTPGDLRNGSAKLTLDSFHAPDVLAECIESRWNDVVVVGRSRVDRVDTQAGPYVTASLDGKLVYLADITPVKNGCSATMYDHHVLQIGPSAYESAVRDCTAARGASSQ